MVVHQGHTGREATVSAMQDLPWVGRRSRTRAHALLVARAPPLRSEIC